MGQSSMTQSKLSPLPLWIRFYFYGMHGFLDEVIFTSIFEFVQNGDWSLKGHSSLYSFLIYGSCSCFTEQLYLLLWFRYRIPAFVRAFIYVLIAYCWEFSFGSVLRIFDACPWDYSHYTFNFMGLICLEYAPAWYLLGLYQDVLANYLLSLRINFDCLKFKSK